MKWNLFLLVYLLLLMSSSLIKAQSNSDFVSFKNFNPASPEMKLFQRYGDIPVNLSSGIPSIDIPLFEIKSGQLSLPISISYHASGIKVEDMASPVGLGWVLNASGSISRTVLGMRDELPGVGFLQMENFLNMAKLQDDPYYDEDDKLYRLSTMSEGSWDMQSDEYYVNIPGLSCRFLYDTNKVIHCDAVDKHIIIGRDLENDKFTITDESGTKYFFDKKEYTTSTQIGYRDPTAWMLSKILSNDGVDSIVFKYSIAAQYTASYYSYQLMILNQYLWPNFVVYPCESELEDFIYTNSTNYQYERLLLDSIIFRNGMMKLNYSTDRQDPIDERLTSISLFSNEGLLNVFGMNQSYFESNGPNPGRNQKRLRLDGIDFRNGQSSVSYSYNFQYNSLTLPAYPSIEYDYWGYYNNNNPTASNLKTLIPLGLENEIISYVYSCGFSSYQPFLDHYHLWASNRDPDEYFASACILQKISYPTGGYSTLEYEGNQTSTNAVGGLRIKKITNYDYSDLVQTQMEYAYGNGDGKGINISPILPHTFFYTRQHFAHPEGYIVCSNGKDFIASSTSVAPINFFNGSPVFYDVVTEYDGTSTDNNGKTVSLFEFEPDKEFGYDVVKYGGFRTNKNWIRGQLVNKKTYDIHNILRKEIKNFYTQLGLETIRTGIICEKILEVNQPLETFLSFCAPITEFHHFLDLRSYFSLIDIDYDFGVKLLSRAEEYDYFQDTVKKITNYFYDSSDHLYLSKKESTQSDSSKIIEFFKYPQDKDSISGLSTNGLYALDSMISKNILTPVIEKRIYKDTLLIEKDLSEYKIPYPGSLKVGYLKRQIGTGQLTTEAEYNYDIAGNIIEQFNSNDVKTSIIWGYSKTLPIAIATNAGPSDIAYTGFEDSDDFGNWGHSGGSRSNSYAKTGSYSMYNTSLSSGVNSKSVVSVWVRNCTPSISGYSPVKTFTANDGWTFYEWIVNPGSFTLIGNSGYLDDARLYPIGSLMKTYTYKPLIGVVTMEDENNLFTYYEYDTFGRLKCIRDNNKKILKNIDYNYKPIIE